MAETSSQGNVSVCCEPPYFISPVAELEEKCLLTLITTKMQKMLNDFQEAEMATPESGKTCGSRRGERRDERGAPAAPTEAPAASHVKSRGGPRSSEPRLRSAGQFLSTVTEFLIPSRLFGLDVLNPAFERVQMAGLSSSVREVP